MCPQQSLRSKPQCLSEPIAYFTDASGGGALVYGLIMLPEMFEISLASLKFKEHPSDPLEGLGAVQVLFSQCLTIPEQGLVQNIDVSLQFGHRLVGMESGDIFRGSHLDA